MGNCDSGKEPQGKDTGLRSGFTARGPRRAVSLTLAALPGGADCSQIRKLKLRKIKSPNWVCLARS